MIRSLAFISDPRLVRGLRQYQDRNTEKGETCFDDFLRHLPHPGHILSNQLFFFFLGGGGYVCSHCCWTCHLFTPTAVLPLDIPPPAVPVLSYVHNAPTEPGDRSV